PARPRPFTAVPPPGGNPTPSGPMLMSHPAISVGVAARPRLGVSTWALAQPAKTIAMTARASSRVDMLDLAVGGHAPRLDRVAVEDRVASVLGDELVPLRLHVAGIVDGTRLEHRRGAIPLPSQAETRERARKDRLRERRLDPGAAAVGRQLDLADLSVPRPREPRDLVEARAGDAHAVRGTRDQRLDLHRIREHERLAVGLQIGVPRRLVL